VVGNGRRGAAAEGGKDQGRRVSGIWRKKKMKTQMQISKSKGTDKLWTGGGLGGRGKK